MKKILGIVVGFAIVAFNGFMLLEGATSKAYDYGPYSTSSVGYPPSCEYDVTLGVDGEIALDCTTSTLYMTPNILGMTGGTATGNRACTVYTNNSTGWTLNAKAGNDTAMQGTGIAAGHSFANISAGAWACASGACFGATTNSSYYFPLTTSDALVNEGSDHNATIPGPGGGTSTTMYYQAVVAADGDQPSGPYTAHVTLTAAMK